MDLEDQAHQKQFGRTNKETSRKPMDQNIEEQGRLEEIHEVLKVVVQMQE